MARLLPAGLTLLVALGLAPAAQAQTPAAAAKPAAPGARPGYSTVTGAVTRPPRVKAPESRQLGFLPPLENPIVELRQYDPFPECFVFLEGGPVAPEATEPVRGGEVWQLGSHAFNPVVYPVVAGTKLEISNMGRETHLLAAEGRDDLVPAGPLGSDSSKSFIVPAPGQAIRIVSRALPHVEGRVVPLPTRYFDRLDRSGRFKIDNVPPGKWNVKVWYRDGWLDLPPRSIDVPGREYRIDLTSEAFGK
jgi:hypothetical protein